MPPWDAKIRETSMTAEHDRLTLLLIRAAYHTGYDDAQQGKSRGFRRGALLNDYDDEASEDNQRLKDEDGLKRVEAQSASPLRPDRMNTRP